MKIIGSLININCYSIKIQIRNLTYFQLLSIWRVKLSGKNFDSLQQAKNLS